MGIPISGPVGEDGGIQQLSAAGALPCFKGAYKIIVLFSEHATFAPWTLHNITLLQCDLIKSWSGLFTIHTKCRSAEINFTIKIKQAYFSAT